MEKNVLVTGASRGIGRAIALKFAANGYNVGVNFNKSEKEALEVCAEIEKFGVRAVPFKFDVTDFKNTNKFVDEVYEKFGKLDAFVNNAGIALDKPLQDKTVEDFQKTLNVNLIAPFMLSKIVGKKMFEQKFGSIVFIGSTSAYQFNPFSVDYDASKAGLRAVAKNLALEFQPYVIVNNVEPGWIKTDMNVGITKQMEKEFAKEIFVGRFGEPREVANLVYFLASNEASFINGANFAIDGGTN